MKRIHDFFKKNFEYTNWLKNRVITLLQNSNFLYRQLQPKAFDLMNQKEEMN